jgi:hypothetical protein
MAFLLFSDFADMAGAQSGTNPPDPFPLRAVDKPFSESGAVRPPRYLLSPKASVTV